RISRARRDKSGCYHVHLRQDEDPDPFFTLYYRVGCSIASMSTEASHLTYLLVGALESFGNYGLLRHNAINRVATMYIFGEVEITIHYLHSIMASLQRIRDGNSSKGYAPFCQPFPRPMATSAHNGSIMLNSKCECYLWIGHFRLIETLHHIRLNGRPIK